MVKQISKKSTFRGPFEKQHVKEDQTLLRSKQHHLYHIYWSQWRQLSWNKSLLVICKVLRMFVNILTGDDKYFLVNRDNLRQPIQMQLSEKKKTISDFFHHFWNGNYILNIFKKRWPSSLIYFRNYRLRKALLIKSLKSPHSEDPSRSNMQAAPNTLEIWTTPPLPYLVITAKAIESEKASLGNMQSLKNLC